MDNSITWCVISAPGFEHVEKWVRSYGITDDGRIFLPAGAITNWKVSFLAASYDGIPMAFFEEQLFLPSDWLLSEYPEQKDLILQITKRIRDNDFEDVPHAGDS